MWRMRRSTGPSTRGGIGCAASRTFRDFFCLFTILMYGCYPGASVDLFYCESMLKSVSNPPNPWESQHREWLEEPPAARPKVWEEKPKSVLSRNESPDIHFRWSLNP